MNTTETKPEVSKEEREMIEEFQCPGCMAGSDIKCGKFKLWKEWGVSCISHFPSTIMMPGGNIALGLPRGFNKLGDVKELRQKRAYIRLWIKGTKPDWDKLNVAVWAMEEKGYLYVRTYSPRTNLTFVDVIQGGKLEDAKDAINVGAFKDEID